MPLRIGFSEHRRRMLQQELERIALELPQLGIHRAVLIGAVAGERVGPASNLELVVVQDTDRPFTARADFFYSHLRPRLGLDVYVYTQEEFEALDSTNPDLARAVRGGVVVYGG